MKKVKLELFLFKKKNLIGVLSDGDLRRELIKSKNLNESQVIFKKNFSFEKRFRLEWCKKIFYNSNFKAIPILDRKQLKGVITSKDFTNEKVKSNIILILAGGKGKNETSLIIFLSQ